MLQGTCSNAGKSLLVAGLCRLFARRGFNVAPFKAQNMSLNSFVTQDGGEMGRAQVLQAQACGLAPDVRMNPVLLKPTGDNGSHVLVLGKPWRQLRAREYMEAKRELWATVQRTYRDLARGRDVMLIEGAGSPAEINLRPYDIVNMRVARFTHANVWLVADIDRGGAFAALAGTLALLTRGERRLVQGLILNKFRGDVTLLDPALDAITRRTGKPFVGTVPWLDALALPDEDGVSLKQSVATRKPDGHTLDIAFIDLPRISNATDLDALAVEEDVVLRPVRTASELGQPDCCILPGTRNTMADMWHLHSSGLATAIRAYATKALATGQGCLVGICGGLQMLGTSIADPLGLENGGEVAGFGLVPLQTTLERDKILRQTSGLAQPPLTEQACAVHGYEIHHGQSAVAGGQSAVADGTTVTVIKADDGAALGVGVSAGTGHAAATVPVWGTYLHGVFDSDAFRHDFCSRLRRQKGLPSRPPVTFSPDRSLDRLADCLEAHLDLQKHLPLCGIPW